MARKIKINKLPAGYHMMPDGRIMRDSDHMMNGGNVLRDVSETGDFNLEAEGGETIVTDKTGNGIPEHYAIEGKRHSKGGVKMKESPGSFIFSDTPKMKLGKELNSFFNKPEGKSYTPAEIAKQYIDMNDDKRAMMDKYSDKLEQSTAALNMFNKTYKLGGLAIAQEAKKGFPDGIPQVAGLYAQLNGIPTGDNTMPAGMQQAKYGAQVKRYQGGEEVPPSAARLDEVVVTPNNAPIAFNKGEKVFFNNQPYLSSRVVGRWNPFVENYNVYSPLSDGSTGDIYLPSDSQKGDSGTVRAAQGKWRPIISGGFAPEVSTVGHQAGDPTAYFQYRPYVMGIYESANPVEDPTAIGFNISQDPEQPIYLQKGTRLVVPGQDIFEDSFEATVVDPYFHGDQELGRNSGWWGRNMSNSREFVKLQTADGGTRFIPAKLLTEALNEGTLGFPTDEPGVYNYPKVDFQIKDNKNPNIKSKDKKKSLRDQAQELAAPQDTIWGESFKYGGSKYEKGGPITPFTAPDGSTGYKYNGVIYKTKEAALAQRQKDTQAGTPSKPAGSGSKPSDGKSTGFNTSKLTNDQKQAYQTLKPYVKGTTSNGKLIIKLPSDVSWEDKQLAAAASTILGFDNIVQNSTYDKGSKEGYSRYFAGVTPEDYERKIVEQYDRASTSGMPVSDVRKRAFEIMGLDANEETLGKSTEELYGNKDWLNQTFYPAFTKFLPEGSYRPDLGNDFKFGLEHLDAIKSKTPPPTPPAEPPTPPATPPPLTPPPASPPSEPPYIPPFPQDEMEVAAAFANQGYINKYPSWAPQVQLPRVRGTFFDPRYANAAAQSSAQMAMDASNAFAGNPSVARAMNAMYQSQSADKQIGNISDIGMKNVATANQMAGMNAEMGSKESLVNAQFDKTVYDQNVASADAYDKESSANLLQNILPSAQNLLTNWAYAKSVPYLTPNYFVDTADAGTIRYTPEYAKKRLNPSTASKSPSFEEYRKGFPDVSADKVAEMYSKQYLSGTSQTPGVDAGSMDPRMMMLYMQMMRNQQG